MPNIDTLNIIKIDIHAIDTEQTGGSDNCCANMHTVQTDDPKQVTVKVGKCYTNTDSISKSNNETEPTVKSKLSKTIEYFFSGLSYDSNTKRSA